MAKQANNNDANLGFEDQLWAAADKLRGNMEPSDYKHVALGLIFLKYISDAFEAKRAALLKEDLADAEDTGRRAPCSRTVPCPRSCREKGAFAAPSSRPTR